MKSLTDFSAASLSSAEKEYSDLDAEFTKTKKDLALELKKNEDLIKKIMWDKKKFQLLAIGGVTTVGLGLLAISKISMLKPTPQ